MAIFFPSSGIFRFFIKNAGAFVQKDIKIGDVGGGFSAKLLRSQPYQREMKHETEQMNQKKQKIETPTFQSAN